MAKQFTLPTYNDPADFVIVRPEGVVERQPEFHPQLARAIADIAHRLAAEAQGGLLVDKMSEYVMSEYVLELRSLLDEFAPSMQVVMTTVGILFASLSLERTAVPLSVRLQWVQALCVPHLVHAPSYREAEARINASKRFLEGQPAHLASSAQHGLWSRALACAMLPHWCCQLSANSKHLGAQLAITTRNLCAVIAECALGFDDEKGCGESGEQGGIDALCGTVATNSLVHIIRHWTRGLRRAPSSERMGWQPGLGCYRNSKP
ncbi:hypothetical protein T492DRAFT_873804 [Pavlovales sp. CCMP2436]|nr:hypothetical protein T492DRAFT_873804 [Pavlovales sp. CCMP2436]